MSQGRSNCQKEASASSCNWTAPRTRTIRLPELAADGVGHVLLVGEGDVQVVVGGRPVIEDFSVTLGKSPDLPQVMPGHQRDRADLDLSLLRQLYKDFCCFTSEKMIFPGEPQ